MDCFALLDDCHASESSPSARLYTGFAGEHRCDDPAALDQVWAQVDRDLRAGLNAVVLADYEWGARLLRAGHEHVAPAAAGCVRFLMFESMRHLAADAVDRWLAECEQRAAEAVGPAASGAPLPAGVLDLRPSVDRAAFHAAIERIHAAIREGETYQVNYTYRIDFNTFGLPVSLYRRLRARQPVGFGALIALPGAPAGGEGAPENEWVLSCSPELFLRNRGGVLAARPMKGTAPRAQVPEGDSEIARMLGDDAKNRAENLMIVDLLRNDLGRIARTGSVRVPALFAVEAYPTVFQMTSSIEAELPSAVSFAELLRALFPCGSITGAPKHRTMQLISELEHGSRGLYTGAIGWIDRPGDGQGAAACGDFCLSVAIRTLTLAPIEPGRVAGRMGGGAGGRRRPAKLQPADLPIGQLAAVVADDADLVPRQRAATGRHAHDVGSCGGGRHGEPALQQCGTLDDVDSRPAPERREGETDRTLGESIDRRDRRAPQSVGGETIGKGLQRRRTHRFGAVQRQPPRAEVETGKVGVGELARAQVIGEVGRRRQRATMPRDHLQPAHRSRQEGQR